MENLNERLSLQRNLVLETQKRMREDRERKYTCSICGKNDVGFTTKDKFDYYIDNDGEQAHGSALSKVFIVCSDECRKKYVLSDSVPYSYLMNDVDIPKRFERVYLNWWDTESDKQTLEAANRWLDSGPSNGLFLYGKTGVGKTALASALVWELRKREKTVLWIDAYDWVVRVNSVVHKYDRVESFIDYHKRFDVVVIDDFSKHNFSDPAKDLLMNLFQYWYSNNTIVVITSNKLIKDISGVIDERLYSRLIEMCPAIAFNNKDRRVITNIPMVTE